MSDTCDLPQPAVDERKIGKQNNKITEYVTFSEHIKKKKAFVLWAQNVRY